MSNRISEDPKLNSRNTKQSSIGTVGTVNRIPQRYQIQLLTETLTEVIGHSHTVTRNKAERSYVHVTHFFPEGFLRNSFLFH